MDSYIYLLHDITDNFKGIYLDNMSAYSDIHERWLKSELPYMDNTRDSYEEPIDDWKLYKIPRDEFKEAFPYNRLKNRGYECTLPETYGLMKTIAVREAKINSLV